MQSRKGGRMARVFLLTFLAMIRLKGFSKRPLYSKFGYKQKSIEHRVKHRSVLISSIFSILLRIIMLSLDRAVEKIIHPTYFLGKNLSIARRNPKNICCNFKKMPPANHNGCKNTLLSPNLRNPAWMSLKLKEK